MGMIYRLESTLRPEIVDRLLAFDSDTGFLRVRNVSDLGRVGLSRDLLIDLIPKLFEQELTSDAKIINNPPVVGAYSAPFKLYLDINTACQLRCPFCLRPELSVDEQISLSIIKKIAQEIDNYGIFYVKIGGGDPFLHPNFISILKAIRSTGAFVTISTNSVSLTPELANFSKELNVRVAVSIEGMEDINDQMRGKGHFAMILKTLSILNAAGTNTILRTTLVKDNLEDVPKLVDFACSLGLKIKFSYCRPSGKAKENHTLLGSEERKQYLKLVDFLNSPAILPFVLLDEGMIIDHQLSMAEKLYGDRMCGAANRSMYVGPTLTVSPCIFLGEDYNAGKLYSDGTIMDFWSGKIGDKFSKIRLVNKPPECVSCSRLCKFECLANRLYFFGSFDRPDQNCLTYAREIARGA